METNNNIRLRLRFYKDVSENIAVVRQKFQVFKEQNPHECLMKIKHNHIWLNIIQAKKEYWSPHLHLELESKSDNETHIRALFGPDPTLWTFFMFLHFIIAGIFVIFGSIAYSNSVLKTPYFMDLIVMLLMVCVWFLLYFIAKDIRRKGNNQMDELELFFEKIIAP